MAKWNDKWEIKSLEEVVRRVKVGYVGSCQKDYCEKSEGVPMIRTTNLTDEGIDLDDLKYITKAFHEKNKKSQLKKNDILIARHGDNGKACIFDKDIDANCLNVVIVEPDEDKALPEFVKYVFDYAEVKNQIQGLTVGSVQSVINTKSIAQLRIAVPPISEQVSFVKALRSFDEKISCNKKINQNLYDQLTAYYNHLFSNLDGSLTVGDLSINIYSGGTPSTSNETYWNGDYYWLSSGETSERFIPSTIKTITQAGIENSSTRKAEKYDLVIASAGQGHTRGQTSMLLTDSYVNQSIIVVHANKMYLPYLFWNISNRYEELRVISNSNSIRGSLTTKMINSLSIPKANTNDIKAFSEYAWSIIYNIENNMQENIRLTSMRDVLLPKLMSGELDVSEIKI